MSASSGTTRGSTLSYSKAYDEARATATAKLSGVAGVPMLLKDILGEAYSPRLPLRASGTLAL